MKLIVTGFLVLLVFSMVTGVAVYWVSPADTGVQQVSPKSLSIPEPQDPSSWESVLKQVSTYYKPDVTAISEEELAAQRQAEAQVKIVTLDDARIVGLIIGDQAKVYVLTPNSVEPTILSVGEGWLDPWKVQAVNRDFVVWHDAQTDETLTQYLFNKN